MMKVLTYVPHGEIPDSRGFAPALVAQNLAAYFKGTSNLHVCAAETLPEGEENDPQWGSIIRIREGRLYRRFFRKWAKLDPFPMHRRLAKIANRYGPDIVHIHQLEFPVAEFRRYLNKPTKVIVHGHTIRKHDPRLGEADLYLAASKYIADGLVAGGYPSEKMSVLYNGVDVVVFAPACPTKKSTLRMLEAVPEDARVVIFFGRKQEVKGFDLFLKSVDMLSAKFSDLLAVSIGSTPANTKDDDSYEACQALKKSLIDRGVLRDYGPLSHQALAEMLKIADVAVLPSRDEPQGMAMIEAMASGLIVLSGNVGGIRESIERNVSGVLVDTLENENPVVEPLEEILKNLEICRSLGINARNTALQKFSWISLAANLEDIYRGLCRH